jgi:hypothetical protein
MAKLLVTIALAVGVLAFFPVGEVQADGILRVCTLSGTIGDTPVSYKLFVKSGIQDTATFETMNNYDGFDSLIPTRRRLNGAFLSSADGSFSADHVEYDGSASPPDPFVRVVRFNFTSAPFTSPFTGTVQAIDLSFFGPGTATGTITDGACSTAIDP